MRYVLIQTLGLFVFLVSISNATDLPRVEQEIEEYAVAQELHYRNLFEEGKKLYEDGKFQASIEKLTEVQEVMDIPGVNFYFGMNYNGIGDYPKAVSYFDKVIELYAKDGFSKDDMYLRLAYGYKLAIAIETEDYVLAEELVKVTYLIPAIHGK